jgi:hypothetical protein
MTGTHHDAARNARCDERSDDDSISAAGAEAAADHLEGRYPSAPEAL